ncbi:MAG: hypothetical protein ABGZ17_23565, partial [Planctomycetaceae bacterium]
QFGRGHGGGAFRLMDAEVSHKSRATSAAVEATDHVDLGRGVSPWNRPVLRVVRTAATVPSENTSPATMGKQVGGGHSDLPPTANVSQLPIGGHSSTGRGVNRPLARQVDSASTPTRRERAEDSPGVGARSFDPSLNESTTTNKNPADWSIVRTDGPTHVTPEIAPDRGLNRNCWCAEDYHWDASGLYHNPLYFQDRGLERFGHSFGQIQPLFSAANFATDFAVFPVSTLLNPWYESVYSLGYPRPGTPSALDRDPPQGVFEYLSNGPVSFVEDDRTQCVDSSPVEASTQESYEPMSQ